MPYFRSKHLQTIQFEIARDITNILAGPVGNPKLRHQSKHRLFPQVLRCVLDYTEKKVEFRGVHPSELGLKVYVERIRDRLLLAIEPDEGAGESPLMPILDRITPFGTTADVAFKTVKPCAVTIKSHLNLVSLDTETWERSTAFRLEESKLVAYYARNEELGLVIPYEYEGTPHAYIPDFLVKLTDGRTLILETKGYEPDQDKAKHEAAKRWVSAVNHWRQLGTWLFHVCRDPQALPAQLASL